VVVSHRLRLLLQAKKEERLTNLKKIAPRAISRIMLVIACVLDVMPAVVTLAGLRWTRVPYVDIVKIKYKFKI
jgi:hypothetical protein